MKQVENINEVLNTLKACGENIGYSEGHVNHMVKLLESFLRANLVAGKGRKTKLNIFKWTADKTSVHKVLQGVLHDYKRKVAVATNSYIMLVSKVDYAPEIGEKRNNGIGFNADKDGTVINKRGEFVEGCYPSYFNVMPKKEDWATMTPFDADKMREIVSKVNSEKKLRAKGIEPRYIKVSGALLLFDSAEVFCTLPDGEYKIWKNNIVAFRNDDCEALMMLPGSGANNEHLSDKDVFYYEINSNYPVEN